MQQIQGGTYNSLEELEARNDYIVYPNGIRHISEAHYWERPKPQDHNMNKTRHYVPITSKTFRYNMIPQKTARITRLTDRHTMDCSIIGIYTGNNRREGLIGVVHVFGMIEVDLYTVPLDTMTPTESAEYYYSEADSSDVNTIYGQWTINTDGYADRTPDRPRPNKTRRYIGKLNNYSRVATGYENFLPPEKYMEHLSKHNT